MAAEVRACEPTLPAAAAAALIAYVLIAAGSSMGGEILLLLGVPLTVAGFVMAGSAVLETRRAARERPFRWMYTALSALAAIGFITPSPRGGAFWYDVAYRVYPLLGLVTVGVFAAGTRTQQRFAVRTAVTAAVALCLLTPIGVPQPQIDVWSWTQFCVRAFLHGVHPYTVQPPDIYHGAFNFGYRTTIYPYMPLTLIVYAPAVGLVGDYRFVLALCLPVTLRLLAAAGQRLSVERRVVDALTLALVLHPRGAYMIAFGWMEPLLLLCLAAFVYLAARAPDGAGQAVAFLLLPALRQYVLAPVIMYLGSSLKTRRRVRAVAIGAMVAAATVAPFVIWNWRATLGGISFNMRAPFGFRDDSDSLTALFASLTGRSPGRWLGPAAQVAVGAPAYLALRRYGLVGLLLASALCLLATFLLGSQAFVNYYYFAEALLLFAALVIAQGPLACA